MTMNDMKQAEKVQMLRCHLTKVLCGKGPIAAAVSYTHRE